MPLGRHHHQVRVDSTKLPENGRKSQCINPIHHFWHSFWEQSEVKEKSISPCKWTLIFYRIGIFFLIFFYWILAPQLIIEATREINIVIITWFIKLLIPWSDSLLISPYITPFESNAKLRRIKEIISDIRIPWLLNKFSLSVLWKCSRSSVEEMNTDVKGVKSYGKMD